MTSGRGYLLRVEPEQLDAGAFEDGFTAGRAALEARIEADLALGRHDALTADDARVLVVATHCADLYPELDYAQLRLDFPVILTGSFEVDNSTKEGLAVLDR